MSSIDQRYQAKLAARAGRTVPVIEQVAEAKNISGGTPEAVDGRYRAKLAAHGKAAAPKVEPEAEAPVAPSEPIVAPEPEKKTEPDAGQKQQPKRGDGR